MSWSSSPDASRMVNMSHRLCVGCHSSVSPFHTGTEEYRAIVSTVDWWVPRYSMPSNSRDSTRAVSAGDSLWPSWEELPSIWVTWAPCWWAATSKALRVRVEVFSKIRAMFMPPRSWRSVPALRAAFSSPVRLSSSRHCAGAEVLLLEEVPAGQGAGHRPPF